MTDKNKPEGLPKSLEDLLDTVLGAGTAPGAAKKEYTADERQGYSAMNYMLGGLIDSGMNPTMAAVTLGTFLAVQGAK